MDTSQALELQGGSREAPAGRSTHAHIRRATLLNLVEQNIYTITHADPISPKPNILQLYRWQITDMYIFKTLHSQNNT